MESHLGLMIVNFILHIINVLLHSFGTFILAKITRQHASKPPMVLLLGLSVTEATINVVETIRYIATFVHGRSKAMDYLIVVDLSGAWVLLYLIMHCIVVDRLLICVLETRYQRIITRKRMMVLLAALAGVSICLMAGTIVGMCVDSDWEWRRIFFMIIYPFFHVTFLTLSLASYSYIFHKIFVESRTKMLSHSTELVEVKREAAVASSRSITSDGATTLNITERKIKPSAMNMLRKFYVSILLVTTYIMFLIIPDLVYLFYGIVLDNMSELLVDLCWLFWNLSNISDAVIYLYINPVVRKEVKRTLDKLCRLFRGPSYI